MHTNVYTAQLLNIPVSHTSLKDCELENRCN